mmetsp:Transcript_16159/g.33653  ORF Transcript_16159/g.33653 Transcript_16159/m.33653 type:complete len:250 (-) Transcript_16159:9-758(-)
MMRLSQGTTKNDSFRHKGHMRRLTLSCCSFCFLQDRMQPRQNAQAQLSSIPKRSPLLRMLSKQIPHSASSPARALRDQRSCGPCEPLAAGGGGAAPAGAASCLSRSSSGPRSPSSWATSTTCRFRQESPKVHEPLRKNLHTLRLPLFSAALTARRAGLEFPVGCISLCQYFRISTSLYRPKYFSRSCRNVHGSSSYGSIRSSSSSSCCSSCLWAAACDAPPALAADLPWSPGRTCSNRQAVPKAQWPFA